MARVSNADKFIRKTAPQHQDINAGGMQQIIVTGEYVGC
jgi:hypothetical protein